ncbi:MAG TPA: heat-inducible transcriptional repressor HrcA [Micropruina sp.]|nr:heat-inducible transcriptional repressor HrcA [Micropruina sp.]HMR21347.1 heat-inducible transcriptional repressor HrcA [Micropruina sp.]
MLDDRKLAILRAIVTDYVSSQEPVGSRVLVERHNLGVSPATVRNDMAVLEEEGYITQPHTSAGRIPTDKGYRLFVDRLASVKPLSLAERRAIQTFMAGALDVDDVVRRTVRLLAQITHQVAIVQYPVLSRATVRLIEVLALTPGRGLVILVNSAGRVDQRPIDLIDAGEEQLAELRGRLNAALVGLAPSAVVDRLSALMDELPPDLRPVGSVVIATLLELVTADPATRVVVGGVPNLTRFGDQFETTVKPVLEALEEQVVLLRLLGEAGGSSDVTVRIGHENPYEPLQSTSVVASAYSHGDDVWASMGIVGPTRMDYPSTMASVRAVARYVGRFLAEG